MNKPISVDEQYPAGKSNALYRSILDTALHSVY
jgi:hypothetical protein